jgi:hypothetical protein
MLKITFQNVYSFILNTKAFKDFLIKVSFNFLDS